MRAAFDYCRHRTHCDCVDDIIGDDDLLEILGQASNPAVIENHLKKLFAGIHSVEFSGDKKTIIAMKSEKKEVVPLNQPVRINDEVETWLQQLAQGNPIYHFGLPNTLVCTKRVETYQMTTTIIV